MNEYRVMYNYLLDYINDTIAFLSLLSALFVLLGIAFYGRRFGDKGACDLLPGIGLLYVITLAFFIRALFPEMARVSMLNRILIAVAMVCRLSLGFVWVWS